MSVSQYQTEITEEQQLIEPTTSLQNYDGDQSDNQSLLRYRSSSSSDEDSNQQVQPPQKFTTAVSDSTNVNVNNTNRNFYHGPVVFNQHFYQPRDCDESDAVAQAPGNSSDAFNKNQSTLLKLCYKAFPEKWCSLTHCSACCTVTLMSFSMIFTILLHLHSSIQPDPSPDEKLTFVTRQEWGAKPPKPYDPAEFKFKTIPIYVIASETGTDLCKTKEKCAEIVRSIQNVHFQANFIDIGFNFLIGGDGRIYEGRGWKMRGCSVYSGFVDYFFDYDSIAIQVSFIGSFDSTEPTQAQLEAALKLFDFAVNNRKISKAYKLTAARQIYSFCDNPGEKLFDILKKWENR